MEKLTEIQKFMIQKINEAISETKENIKKAARWELWNPWAKWYEFNSTHPLISKRIKSS